MWAQLNQPQLCAMSSATLFTVPIPGKLWPEGGSYIQSAIFHVEKTVFELADSESQANCRGFSTLEKLRSALRVPRPACTLPDCLGNTRREYSRRVSSKTLSAEYLPVRSDLGGWTSFEPGLGACARDILGGLTHQNASTESESIESSATGHLDRGTKLMASRIAHHHMILGVEDPTNFSKKSSEHCCEPEALHTLKPDLAIQAGSVDSSLRVDLPQLKLLHRSTMLGHCEDLINRLTFPASTRLLLYPEYIRTVEDIRHILVPIRNHLRASTASIATTVALTSGVHSGMHYFQAVTYPDTSNSHPTPEQDGLFAFHSLPVDIAAFGEIMDKAHRDSDANDHTS
ncbi:hypothetical protein B0H16DRAFT_1696086 [Mycena metata]|uniref:Uncharacterized protein n=1 Tax=Mycena metata TaxID=1033252 RepID=A0AAD7I436_9AGAR|nr:hypothetical protein B0H16DRAFT_1696086 [Mycena metata]